MVIIIFSFLCGMVFGLGYSRLWLISSVSYLVARFVCFLLFCVVLLQIGIIPFILGLGGFFIVLIIQLNKALRQW